MCDQPFRTSLPLTATYQHISKLRMPAQDIQSGHVIIAFFQTSAFTIK